MPFVKFVFAVCSIFLCGAQIQAFTPRFPRSLQAAGRLGALAISRSQTYDAIVKDNRRITAIYLNPDCPYCKKVLADAETNDIDLDKFGIAKKYVVTEGGKATEYKSELLRRTGRGTVPALEIGGQYILFESIDITEALLTYKNHLLRDEQIRRLRAGETQRQSERASPALHGAPHAPKLLSQMTKEELLAEYNKIKHGAEKDQADSRWAERIAISPNEVLAEVPDWARTESMLNFHSGQLDSEGDSQMPEGGREDDLFDVEAMNLEEDEYGASQ